MSNTLRFFTAGESHGKALFGFLEGIPANLPINPELINLDLNRRQGGYGRGGRMKIESDQVEIVSGVRWGKTTGAPLSLLIYNKDHANWSKGMSISPEDEGSISAITRPRPGHADLCGVLKYHQRDARNILERSSARETAMRVALGAVAKILLKEFAIAVGSFVVRIGQAFYDVSKLNTASVKELQHLHNLAEASVVRCPDADITALMTSQIDLAITKGDTLGGEFVVFATGLPVGLGSHTQWDRKLNARLAYYIMSIQAIKAVSIGLGFDYALAFGSEAMDEIYYDTQSKSFFRKTNYAGGIEGGMSNGMPIIVKAVMKPIPTLRKPLSSVDIITKEPFEAIYERSDTCAVASASVVAEAMLALCIADAFLEKFAGDSLEQTKANYEAYIETIKSF